ncbi:hypothetical protein [Brevibacillus sp. SKDU10]|uniref:hypothetical protein n=1 Tax=Brevibacillus sp. SKDU10 TaxID=1247872 RepID=UPI0018D323D5|nr:hypothetical protein [Brevibacillus sp. SKDU10]
MTLKLIAKKGGPNVFAAYYERLVARQMPKMKAIGHMSGKGAKIIYSVLKPGVPYDPKMHTAACGILWYEKYKEKLLMWSHLKLKQKCLPKSQIIQT